MKILILSSGRSGSTILLDALSNQLDNPLTLFEPLNPNSSNYIKDINKFHTDNKLLNNTNIKNLIEKHLVYELINGYYFSLKYNINLPLDHFTFDYNIITKFYVKYIKNFDRVILLKRNNIDELAHSFYHARKNDVWHEPYKPKEIDDNEFLKKQYFLSKKYNDILTNLSKITKLPIILYEDLFSGDKDYIKYFLKIYDIKVNNFNNFCNYFNPNNRYKQI